MKKLFLLCCLFSCSLFAAPGQDIINYSKFSEQKDDAIVAAYKEEGPWGMSVSIDLHSANPQKIRDGKYITQFMKDLVKFIKMKAYGEPIVVNFGSNPRVAGYSALQLIETSSITAHFANSTNSVHIDIFSCKFFKPHEAALWCKEYFDAVEMNVSPVVFRF
jgi:S-adenosylmethionine/arginine decarboxylase-like enzyme